MHPKLLESYIIKHYPQYIHQLIFDIDNYKSDGLQLCYLICDKCTDSNRCDSGKCIRSATTKTIVLWYAITVGNIECIMDIAPMLLYWHPAMTNNTIIINYMNTLVPPIHDLAYQELFFRVNDTVSSLNLNNLPDPPIRSRTRSMTRKIHDSRPVARRPVARRPVARRTPIDLNTPETATIMDTIVEHECTYLFMLLSTKYKYTYTSATPMFAAMHGDLPLLKCIRPFTVTEKLVEVAIKYQHIHVIEYIATLGKVPVSSQAYSYILASGQFGIFGIITDTVVDDAGISVVDDIKDRKNNYSVVEEAAYHGMDMVHKFIGFGFGISPLVFAIASQRMDRDLMSYLISISAPIDATAMEYVAKTGDLEIVEYVHSLDKGINKAANDNAALAGNADVLEFIYSKYPGCTLAAVPNACSSGSLRMVKFLIEKKRKYNTDAMDTAVKFGNLRIIQYLHSQGATCSRAAYDYAYAAHNPLIFQYLIISKY